MRRGSIVFNFGKHRGRHIDQVDDIYLQWIVNHFQESDWWWKAAATALTNKVKLKLLSELKDCTRRKDLLKGRRLHTDAVKLAGIHSNIYVAPALINMYTKCGSIEEARTVFDSIEEPNVVCWNVLILGYANNGQGSVALQLFSRMKDEGKCTPDSFTYIAALKACTLLAADGVESGKKECLERGRQIHSEIGHHMDLFGQSTLINLYSKCGSIENAREIFDSIQKPDVVCWNAIIMGYADNGQGLVALDLFSRMKDQGRCAPDYITYISALKACTLLAADGGEAGKRKCLERGREIHYEIGRHMNHFAQSTLINLYSKCGSIEDAKTVFDSIQKPDMVCWTSIIMGHADNGQGLAALDLFFRMKNEGRCTPDYVTYIASLKACTLLAADGSEAGKRVCLERGRQIHSEVGRHMNHSVQSMLINLYAKCGSMEDARTVFDSVQKPDVVCWNAIILGYAENGQCLAALDLFSRMKDEGRCSPDYLTYICALKACTLLAADGEKGCLERGRQIHSEIGRHMNHFAQSTLINLYSKCGCMEDARKVFDSIQEPDVVCWTAIIMGYADNGQGLVAVDMFSRMKDEGRCAPDSVTYIAALKACCSIGALTIGRRIHSGIRQFNPHLVTCLVDFYADCGNMEEAREVFDLHPQARIVATWNALLAGYARFGDTSCVFGLFDAMQDQGFQPNAVTFVCMLSCCSHAGLVEKAREYLELMHIRYEVTPSVMHYSCMIDLLGRANKLDEAVALLQKMPCDPNSVTWTALLGASRKWKNVEIGRWAFKSLINLDPKKAPAAYVLMADIYGSRDMWEDQARVLEESVKFGAKFMVGEEDGTNIEKQILKSMKDAECYGISRSVIERAVNTPLSELSKICGCEQR